MGYYQDLYEKSKKTGTSQTKYGGTVSSTTSKSSGSGANVVSNASSNLGAGKATGSTSNKGSSSSSNKSSGSSTGGGIKWSNGGSTSNNTTSNKNSGANVVANASSNLGAGQATNNTVSNTASNTTSGANAVSNASANLGAGKTSTDIALEAYKQLQDKLSGANEVSNASANLGGQMTNVPTGSNTVGMASANLGGQMTNAPTGSNVVGMASASLGGQMTNAPTTSGAPTGSNTVGMASGNLGAGLTTAPNEQDDNAGGNGQTGNNVGYQLGVADSRYNRDTILNHLAKYGLTEADLGGIPLEALYYGNGDYMGSPYLLTKPDDYVFQDHNGNRITVGDLKYALLNGLYRAGNENAYNSWVAGVATNPPKEVYVDPYEELEDDYSEGGYTDDIVDVGTTGGTTGGTTTGTTGGTTGTTGNLPDYAGDIINAQNAVYQALIDALNGQRGTLNDQYNNNAADLYAQYRRSSLALPELLAGTATGIADSYTLQNNLNYQNNLYANEQARAGALNDLQTQVNQYQADANLQAAQTAAEWAQLLYQQQMNEQALQREYEMQKQAADREYQLALMQIQNKGSSSSNSDKSSSYEPKLTYAQVKEAIKDGNITTQVKKDYQYYMGEAYGEDTTTQTKPASTLPGVTGSVSAMTKDDVVSYLTKRFYTNLTPDNIAKALNQLMENGLPESVANAVAKKYGMEMQ